MKRLIVLSALVVLLASCGNNDKKVATTDATNSNSATDLPAKPALFV